MTMDHENLVTFFQKGRIVIPIYQRNYDWGKSNCKKLLEDTLEIAGNGPDSRGHFTGAIIFANDQMDHVIIDGQQRITTVQLMLLALRDTIAADAIRCSNPNVTVKISLYIGEDEESVLRPSGKDGIVFKKLFEGKMDKDWYEENYGDTNIWQNYCYLCDEVSKLDISAEELLGAIGKLWVVLIGLEKEDDPQSVFESINTTGVKLSDSDRIRNFIMMNHTVKEQQAIYDEYWTKIEEYVGVEIEQFFFEYVRSITMAKVVKTDHGVYNLFKKEHPELKGPSDIEYRSLEKIRKYAKIYHDMSAGNIDEYASPEASRSIRYINYLEQKVSYSLIMNILYASSNGKLSAQDATMSLKHLETFMERRLAAKYNTNVLNGFLPPLFRVVNDLPGDAPFPDKLAYVLASKRGGVVDPDDDVIRETLKSLPVYKSKRLCAVLLAIADHMNNNSPDTLKDVERENGLTIDHILPQNPGDEWHKDVPNLIEVHDKYVDTIGNLTLTAYNSNFGNRSYAYRRNVNVFGYLHSPLHIDDYMKASETWGEKEIVERADILISSFLKNRPIPSTHGYVPDFKTKQWVSLDDDARSLTNKEIIAFEFNSEQPVSVNTMKECCLCILERLYNDHPDEFTSWAFSSNNGFKSRFSATEKNSYVKLGPGMFVNLSLSNHDKFCLLSQMLRELNINGSKIRILYRQKVQLP